MNSNAKEVSFQEKYKLFVGFDWASDHHDVVAVDASGQVVLEFTLEDTAEGWASLRRKLTGHRSMSWKASADRSRTWPMLKLSKRRRSYAGTLASTERTPT